MKTTDLNLPCPPHATRVPESGAGGRSEDEYYRPRRDSGTGPDAAHGVDGSTDIILQPAVDSLAGGRGPLAGALPGAPSGPPSESLSSLLWSREQVARCSADLATYLNIDLERAEVLLLSQAQLRGVPVGELAHAVRGHTSPARQWRAARCSSCRSAGRLRICDGLGLQRVLVCPAGHGTIW